ncbi:Hypothetical_protein [Hexamita inflata]|uniref:Hypothetical_protein n=1 Tax=Hexamita inflata TaxID=28002 RepID=A0ABP1HFI1_9EUKA
MSVLMRRENTLIIEPGSDISKIQIINFILLPNSKKHFEGPPLYMNAMFLLQSINTSLLICAESKKIVVPLKYCIDPHQTVNYWFKLNFIVASPFVVIYIAQCITTLKGFPIVASILGWISNMLVVYINLLEIIAAYQFQVTTRQISAKLKIVSLIQIILTVVNSLTLSTSNFWFAITDLINKIQQRYDESSILMIKNIVYCTGSIVQDILIIQLNIKISITISKSSEVYTEIYT